MADYFVKNAGDDAKDGLSDANAWKTISKVNGSSFSAGDTISFNKGDSWREQLTVPSSGSSGSEITFQAYGSGADPIIDGSDLVATWTASLWNETNDLDTEATSALSEAWYRNVVPSTVFSSNGLEIRVQVESHSTTGIPIDGMSIGERSGSTADYASAPTRITFDSGNNTVVLSAGEQKWSDWITYAWDNTKDHIVHVWVDDVGGNIYRRYTGSAFTTYYGWGDGDVTMTQDVTEQGSTGARYFVQQIEIRVGNNVWQATLTTEPREVFFDDTRGTNESALANLNTALEWFWTGNILYVYAASDPDTLYTSPGVEATVRSDCIKIQDQEYLIVNDLKLIKSRVIALEIKNTTGGAKDYFVIDNVTLDKNAYIGIYLNGSGANITNAEIKNCTISWCYNKEGIYDYQNAPSAYIHDNTVSYSGQDNIRMNTAGSIAENNDCSYGGQEEPTGAAGIMLSKSSQIARYNKSYNNTAEGIWAGAGSNINDCQIYYNLCYNNDTDGIYLNAYCVDFLIYNNAIYGSVDGFVINNSNCTGTVFKNNIVENSSGVNISFVAGVAYTGDYNCFDENDSFYQDTTTYTFAQWKTLHSGDEGNSLYEDPVFIDAANDKFSLQSTSPCIDAGVDVSLTTDYAGSTVPAPTGGSFDIGAFEYVKMAPAVATVTVSTPSVTPTVQYNSAVSTGGAMGMGISMGM